MATTLNPGEEAQLQQTIEMFEVIVQSQPDDCQSLEILKEAYTKLGREADVIKTSKRIAEAKAQGLGVIAYYPAPAQLTSESVQTVASQLSPRTDAIIVPNAGPYGYLANDIAEVAVSTGLPIWPSLLHRKADLTHYRALGMAGAITSDVGYLSGRTEPARADQWSSGRAVSGELTRDPSDDRYAVKWGPDGLIKLGATKVQHFLTLGNLGPITASSYTVEFEASYDELPRDPAANITLAFGHEDDRYYEHRLGLANGYHAILQADNNLISDLTADDLELLLS